MHYRTDFPDTCEAFRVHSETTPQLTETRLERVGVAAAPVAGAQSGTSEAAVVTP